MENSLIVSPWAYSLFSGRVITGARLGGTSVPIVIVNVTGSAAFIPSFAVTLTG